MQRRDERPDPMAPADNGSAQPPVEIPRGVTEQKVELQGTVPKTNVAFRHRYRNSQRRTNYTGYLIVLAAFVPLVVVVWFFLNAAVGPSLAGRTSVRNSSLLDNSASSNDAAIVPEDVGRPKAAAGRDAIGSKADLSVAVRPGGRAGGRAEATNVVSDLIPSNEPPNDLSDASSTPAILSAEDTDRVNQLLARARASIDERSFAESDRLLQQAGDLAVREEIIGKLNRLQMLSDYVAEFWQAFDESLVDLEGAELTIDNEQVFVVKADSRRVVIRARGQNREYSISDMPPKLVVAIADRRFDQNAVTTNVFKGAYMAVEPAFGAAKARALWREAVEAGVELEGLPRVLTDSYE